MKTDIRNYKSWKSLQSHYEDIKDTHMRDMFESDPERHDKMSLHVEDILLDYSKNRLNDETLKLLIDLANEAKVPEWRERMFAGEKINDTEDRSVLHTALRDKSNTEIFVDNVEIKLEISKILDKMQAFSDKVRNGSWVGYTNKAITDIVNIGIGGSDLGPKMVCAALDSFHHPKLTAHFISNVDGTQFSQVIRQLNPETTLFIIASKTFTTQETMTNANSARDWFLLNVQDENQIAKHFVAVSTNKDAVVKFGISTDNMFEIWDWVGGRYSVWSSVSLIVTIMIGMDNFEEFLSGGSMMDDHFKTAPLADNMPVVMALIGIWYNNFFNCESYAILPYDHQLAYFPSYFEQMDMESNGKSIDKNSEKVQWTTGPVVWGEQGINGQHAFYQLIHQGTKIIPADFIASILPTKRLGNHHDIMMSNFFAQPEALYKGRDASETKEILKKSGVSEERLDQLTPHMIFDGNQPTNSLIFRKLTPRSLGALVALYEHKVFVQGIIWNINSYDQWGVELGKILAKEILDELSDGSFIDAHDSSTNNLINYYKLVRYT